MGQSVPTSKLTARTLRMPARPVVRSVADALRWGQTWASWRPGRPAGTTAEWQRDNAEEFARSIEAMRRFEAGAFAMGTLWGVLLRKDAPPVDLGLMACRVVTNAGVGYLVDSLQGIVEPEAMRYHALGTGTTAEAATQTALVTELTTQYTPANTRATGSQGEASGDPKTYETIATITVGSAVNVTEHGLFSSAGSGTGVMLDRSVFAAVPLGATESLATTYQFTIPSGS